MGFPGECQGTDTSRLERVKLQAIIARRVNEVFERTLVRCAWGS